MSRIARTRALAALVAGVLLAALSACGDDAAAGGNGARLRLGYFPNLTHATAIVGVERGYFAEALGATKLETKTFNAGPAAVEALLTGAIDATYIGPGPATNAYAKSKGKAVRIVSGATSGGAALVVRPTIRNVAALRGKKIATPQLANTQDIALRYWLRQHRLTTTKEGGGDVRVVPQDNSQTVDTFGSGAIDGAWVPEPYASRLVNKGGRVLLDEKSLWPGGKYVTTNLLVRTDYLAAHPDVVRELVAGQVDANEAINSDPSAAQATVAEAIGALTGKPLKADLVAQAWKRLTFTDDPVPGSLLAGAQHAVDVDLLEPVDNLEGIYDLGPLNAALKAKGLPEVAAP